MRAMMFSSFGADGPCLNIFLEFLNDDESVNGQKALD
jgi:hypothetical protein